MSGWGDNMICDSECDNMNVSLAWETNSCNKDRTAPTAGAASSSDQQEEVYGESDDEVVVFLAATEELQVDFVEHCFLCKHNFVCQLSCVAYLLDAPGFPFAVLEEPDVLMARGQYVNIYDGRRALPACAWCAGMAHGKIYFKVRDGEPTTSLTNEWKHQRNKTLGVGLKKHHSEMTTVLHVRKELAMDRVLFAEQNNWVTRLSGGAKPFLWLLYGCAKCRMWTVRPNHFYRCLRRVAALTDNVGHWRCCGCFSKWTWANSGYMRLVVLGFANEHSGFEHGYQFALIRSTPEDDDAIDAKINLLQTATLLTQLNGRPVSEEALLAPLEIIQQRFKHQLSNGMNMITIAFSKYVSTYQLDCANVDIICQGTSLSMPGPGRRMLVIERDTIELFGMQVQEMDPADFHVLLDVAGSTYNIEDVKGGKLSKSIKQQILRSGWFKAGRSAIEQSLGSSSPLVEV